jgi:hypothetical protein
MRHAQQTVQNQKKSLEQAATFTKNRDTYLRTRQSDPSGSLRVGTRPKNLRHTAAGEMPGQSSRPWFPFD